MLVSPEPSLYHTAPWYMYPIIFLNSLVPFFPSFLLLSPFQECNQPAWTELCRLCSTGTAIENPRTQTQQNTRHHLQIKNERFEHRHVTTHVCHNGCGLVYNRCGLVYSNYCARAGFREGREGDTVQCWESSWTRKRRTKAVWNGSKTGYWTWADRTAASNRASGLWWKYSTSLIPWCIYLVSICITEPSCWTVRPLTVVGWLSIIRIVSIIA